MSDPRADRNLLFGVLALQLDFIGRDALIAALNAWAHDKRQPLGRILLEQGALAADAYSLLEALVQKHLEMHGDDAEKSLAAVGSVCPVRQALAPVADSDVQTSLDHIAALSDTDPGATDPPTGAGGLPPHARFRVLRPHARGGLGEVFVAHDEELNREVALKEIQERHAGQPESRARFLLEAEVTGQLEHPGVVPVYGLGTYADGRPFYAMRFIQGDSLKDAIRAFHDADLRGRTAAERSLALRRLLGRFVDVCNAVAYAHSRGVLHRDLKPGNVLLGKYGETLVVDWGLAKVVGRAEAEAAAGTPAGLGDSALTQTGKVLGTPAFMSPEQAAGRLDQVGPRSDVYSLGATLYCLLTGRPPFTEGDVGSVLDRVRRGDFAPPRQANRRVPAALEAVCLRAMALRPEVRYAGPREVAEEVEHWLADEPVQAHREPLTSRAGRLVRRHQTLAAWVAAALLTGVIALGVSTWLVGGAQRETAKALTLAEGEKVTADAERRRAEGEKKTADDERRRAEKALRQTQLVSARLALDRGLTLCDQGDVGTGLLWYVRGLELAPADEAPLQAVLRANLAAWRGQLSTLRARLEHPTSVWAAAFTPDGRTVVTGTIAKRGVWLWDAATGRRLGEPLAHPTAVNAVAVSPDGKLALTGGADGKARLWDLERRALVGRPFEHKGPVYAVAFRPDGKAVATGGSADRLAQLWDVATGERIGSPMPHGGTVRALAFRSDGEVLLTGGSDGVLRRWEAATGKPAGAPLAHKVPVVALAWSPDGKSALVGDMASQAQVWDVAAGKPAGPPLTHTGFVVAAAYSPDGRTMATGSASGHAYLWDAATGRPVGQPLPHQGGVTVVAFDRNGGRLLTASEDFSVRLWEPASARAVVADPQVGPAVRAMSGAQAIRPDGRVVAFGSLRGPVQLAEVATGKPTGPVRAGGGPVGKLAFSPDGKKVLVGTFGKGARLYDADTWEPAGPPLPQTGQVKGVAFAANGRLVLTASLDGTARVWEAATGKPVGPVLKHPDPRFAAFLAVAGAPDGKTVLTADVGGTLWLWDAATGKAVRTLRHEGQSFSVAFSPDGRRLAAGGNAARVWDASTGRPVTPPLRHLGAVAHVAFSADGRLLLTASSDRTARLWDVATGKRVGPHLRHADAVRSAAFGPDGHAIVTVDADWLMRTWKVPTRLDAGPRRLVLWAQVLSGLELDGDGGVHVLSAADWQQRRQQLAALGGPSLP